VGDTSTTKRGDVSGGSRSRSPTEDARGKDDATLAIKLSKIQTELRLWQSYFEVSDPKPNPKPNPKPKAKPSLALKILSSFAPRNEFALILEMAFDSRANTGERSALKSELMDILCLIAERHEAVEGLLNDLEDDTTGEVIQRGDYDKLVEAWIEEAGISPSSRSRSPTQKKAPTGLVNNDVVEYGQKIIGMEVCGKKKKIPFRGIMLVSGTESFHPPLRLP